ncbi:AAA family ATPase [Candidatus Oscillochloris fontis]|uniref:AAA family ATPase n=1 Tax=Candidatus Oscillochloris fontis TaxID=2496868 RepID=UPI00101D0FD6|nr:adenylate/guanylate cyclase domain-containing protein [Candidatus Oscillochloris fontis]
MPTSSAPLADLASYLPAFILRRMNHDVALTMAPTLEHFPAAALFADLTGFTALTEQLSLHNPAGTEELTQILDLYFGHLVRVVTAHGGDVMKFAGDGLLALWYGEEDLAQLTQRAVQCGLAVQMMMSPEMWGSFETPTTPLKIRVGVGAGQVTTMHVGGIFGRWELLVTGEPIRQTGLAESQAQPGDVVIAAEAWPLVAESCMGVALPTGGVRLVSLTDYLPMRGLDVPVLRMDMADSLRFYLPKAILARMDAGQTAWLAEQRRVTVLFINLPDLQAETPLPKAQAMMRSIQSMLYRYEGSISRLGTDAKGPTLVAALGLPPFSHEDDPERGARAALDIHTALAEQGFRCAIGITTGQALCGAVGGEARREYTMMGSMVNRSARLMQAAAHLDPNNGVAILCDTATMTAARHVLRFERLAPLRLKGVSEPMVVYRPLALALPAMVREPLQHMGTLIGRNRELAIIDGFLNNLALHGRRATLILEGDEGIGKTRLLHTLEHAARQAGVEAMIGIGRSVDAAPYGAWRSVFSSLLLNDAAQWPADLLGEDLMPLAPLLRAVLHVDLPETTITAQMSGQVRADNTRDLLVRLLDRATQRNPLVIMIEDAQWLDTSSWALLAVVAERVERLLLAIAIRPLSDPPAEYQRLAYLPDTRRIHLSGLEPSQIHDLLAQRLGVDRVPTAIWHLIADRSQGNPFFSEELLHALRQNGLITVVGRECQIMARAGDPIQILNAVPLPSTIEGLIISRIDRLSPAQQLTLKVASVIGRSFALSTLSAIHPVENDPNHLVEQLFTLQQAGLVLIEEFDPELVYSFRHAVVAEVAYNLMSFRQRRQLHRTIAEYYEADGDAAQLAYHWRQADEPDRAMGYLARAGEQALTAGAYQEASNFLREAIQISGGGANAAGSPDLITRVRWERQLAEAYHGLGRLNESRDLLERAEEHLSRLLPVHLRRTMMGLSWLLVRQGVRTILPLPAPRREPDSELLREAARTSMLLAQLSYYNSQLPEAIRAALRSLSLAERSGETPELAAAYASAHLATGIIAPLARRYQQRALDLAHQINHLPTYAWVYEAQGIAAMDRADWRRASAALNLALVVAEHLGDQRRRAECHGMLALADLLQGNLHAAQERYAELYAAAQARGDLQVCAWGLIGQAECLIQQDADPQALALLEVANGLLAENLGSTRAEEIWAYGLHAKLAWRSGNTPLAQTLADTADDLVGEHPPVAIYALGGYVALAEVLLELWATKRQPRRLRRITRMLGQLARIFPMVRPAVLMWRGRAAWLRGQQQRARRYWQRAANLAAQMGMPSPLARRFTALAQTQPVGATHLATHE